MTIHLSNDLMLVAKVSSWANANNVPYKSVSGLEKLRGLLDSGDVQRVIVDLQFKSLDIAEVARLVRSAAIETCLFGYAQHVLTELIEQANQAGFDKVLTRGQFDRGFPDLFVD